MFNYIKDAIINDVKALELKPAAGAATGHVAGLVVTEKDANGVPTGAELVVKRFGNYKLEGMKNLFVTKGVEGANGVYKVSFDELDGEVTSIYHIEICVKMDGKYLGEYANANWAKFGKKFIVEVNGKADTAKLQAALEEAAKDTVSPLDGEQKIFTVSEVSTSGFTLTLTNPYLSIAIPHTEDGDIDADADVPGIFVGKLDTSDCPSACGMQDFEEMEVKVVADDTTEPVLPFATGEWLMENLRVPTYYNRRFGAVGEKNYPVAGQLYDQIAFEYVMDRPGLGGLSAVGQKIQSATTHVLYVPAGSVTIGDGSATSLETVASVTFTAATDTTPAQIKFA